MIIYFLVILLLLGYGFILRIWNKSETFKLKEKVSRILIKSHYLFLGILLFDILNYFFTGFHYRGLWTSRIVIFGYIFTGIFTFPLSRMIIFKKIEVYYFKLLSFSPSLLGVFMIIPFYGFLSVLMYGGQLVNPAEKILNNDKYYRIQTNSTGPLGYEAIETVEKNLLFERKTRHGQFDEVGYDSVKVTYTENTIEIEFISLNSNLVGINDYYDKLSLPRK